MAFIDTFRLENYGEFCAINATTVEVTLAEVAAEAPAAGDFAVTIGEEAVAVTNVALKAGTDKTYTLSVALAGKEGLVKVNGKEAAAAVDYKKPVIANVQSLNAKTIVVTYSEKVDATTALDATKYTLFSVQTGASTELVANATNFKIAANLAFTDATQTAVKITIIDVGNGTAIAGYPMGGLANAEYYLYVTGVKDASANANEIVPNSNKAFTGTTTPDSTGPVLTVASYDTADGSLTLTFDKAVKTGADADGAKYTIVNGDKELTLSGVQGVAGANASQLKFTLTSAQLTTLGTLQTGAKVIIAVGGVRDTAGNANAAVMEMAMSFKARPQLTDSAYDENTNKITLNFSQAINKNTIDVAKIKVQYSIDAGKNWADLWTLASANLTIAAGTETYATQLVYTLKQAAIDTIKGQRNTENVTYRIAIDDNAVNTADGTFNVIPGAAPQTANFNYTKETVAPALNSAEYYEAGDAKTPRYDKDTTGIQAKHIYVKFDQKLRNVSGDVTDGFDDSPNVLATAKAYLSYGDTPTEVDLSATGLNFSAGTLLGDNQTLDITIDTNHVTYAAFLAAMKTGKANVLFKKGSIVSDVNGNVIAKDADVKLAITYNNNQAPSLAAIQADGTEAANTFSNYQVALKSPTGFSGTITKANFTLVNAADNSAITIDAVDVIDTDNDGTKDTVFVRNDAGLAANVKLFYTGLKDASGRTIDDAATASLLKSNDATTPALVAVNGKVYTDNGDGKISSGDKITLTFKEPVQLGTTPTLTQYGTGATLAAGTAANQVVITLGSSPTITFDTALTNKLEATGNDMKISDYSQNGATKDYDGSAETIPVPTGAEQAKIVSAVFEDVNKDGALNAGDTLTVKFTKDVSSSTLTDIGEGDFVITGKTLDLDETKTKLSGNDTIVLTLVGSTNNWAIGDTIDVASSNDIKNAWGRIAVAHAGTVADPTVKITSPDTERPTITAAAYIDADASMTNSLGDILWLTFSKPVTMGTALADTDFAVANGTVGTVVYAAQVFTTVVVLTLPADNTLTTVGTVSTIDVKGLGCTKVKDASGNVLAPSTPKALTDKALDAKPATFAITDKVGVKDTLALSGLKANSKFHVFKTDGTLVAAAGTAGADGTVAAYELENKTTGTFSYYVAYQDADGNAKIVKVSYTAAQ